MDLKKLEQTANLIRQDIIGMLLEAKSGHSAGPLGMADVFTAIYFGDVIKHDPKKPEWEERDRIVLSNGHICPVLYATLAHAGYFPVEELKTLRKLGTRLQGHPHYGVLPGIESTSGPLAQGLSQAVGMGIAFKMDKKKNQVICLTGDGEQDEGQIWEAVMLAGKLKMDNLTQIIDRNNIQIDGFTEDVMPLESLEDKYEAFGWHVIEVNGHNIEKIIDAINMSKAIFEKPVVIIAHTIPGKGVEFMEFDFKWHGMPPNKEQADIALKQLRTLGGKITSEHE
ncbi:MAG: transketolase [Candidatus Portnoybacteria bacterium CG10_big_fil_rev_8_21_14_0_10_36_7]|uniref:Transketolase n=1 Tax=Candidatus Portnoybacteria bacterium CG10_big_fil_rev_8_21_14_0_10_36_7 TaxID=1974812 RepID=A0A2M8KET2_9BACT|nr:MAG: transketolase [Candidatus Portnoybacteria bacterium CG10_big_fil_rev_8_21_14_0_10_36_7]